MACVRALVGACVRVSLAPTWCVRTSNFYAQYSTSKHEAALCLWNAKNGEKNPDNVPERRAHRVTHQARSGGGGSGSAGPTVTAAYSVIYPHRTPTVPCACPWNRPVRTAGPPVFRRPTTGNTAAFPPLSYPATNAMKPQTLYRRAPKCL